MALSKRDLILLGVGIGIVAQRLFKKYMPTISIITDSDLELERQAQEANPGLFDCPACGLPAEINTIITEKTEQGLFVTNYIIRCFGDHKRVAVTERWLAENARSE